MALGFSGFKVKLFSFCEICHENEATLLSRHMTAPKMSKLGFASLGVAYESLIVKRSSLRRIIHGDSARVFSRIWNGTANSINA
jgi:hypothetical protein